MTADEYNAKEAHAGRLRASHVTELTRRFQRSEGMEADGVCGPTERAWLELLTGRLPGGEPVDNTKITEHFLWTEFACKDGTVVPDALRHRVVELCTQLEVLRADLGVGITIMSGYRSPAWNAHEGGAEHSQHVEGRAADIRVVGKSPGQVRDAILRLIAAGKMHDGGLGYYPEKMSRGGWIHYDVRAPGGARWTG